jgi:hypothetical protein
MVTGNVSHAQSRFAAANFYVPCSQNIIVDGVGAAKRYRREEKYPAATTRMSVFIFIKIFMSYSTDWHAAFSPYTCLMVRNIVYHSRQSVPREPSRPFDVIVNPCDCNS